MKKENKVNKSIAIIFFAVIAFFFVSIAVRTVTRQVFVKRMGMDNKLIDLVFFDSDDMAEQKDMNDRNIDWESLYPFRDDTTQSEQATPEYNILKKALVASTATVDNLESKISSYSTELLPFYRKIVSAAKEYEKQIRWNIVSYSEYNGVITLSDGYFSGIDYLKDVDASVKSIKMLKDFCDEREIDLLYVQYPGKNCIYKDTNVCGITDFSNQNADNFLKRISEEKIPCYDLRKEIHAEGLDHHEVFFRTDHHWKPETGLWAARKILSHLNDNFGYDFDADALDADNFNYVVYPNWFLGSEGKKVTLAKASPEDFTMIYPKFETKLNYSIQSIDLEMTGDFSVIYWMDCVQELNYDNICYSTYDYGDRPLIRIRNLNSQNMNNRILIIQDSFSKCVSPFLSLGSSAVDEIDRRRFTGSIQSFIEQEKPNVVIVAYNPTSIQDEVNLNSHTGVFNFR